MKEQKREPGPWMNDWHPTLNPRHDVLYMGESLTRQSEAESCDINLIMKRLETTGMLPEMIKQEPSYGDFSSMPDYLEAQNIVAFAKSQFAGLNAQIRKSFDNDPAKMLQYVEEAATDPEKQKTLVKLGLAVEMPQPQANKASAPAASAASTKKKGSGAAAPVPTAPEAE